MKLQQARRTNPYPWTWEIPVAVIVAVLLIMAVALHAARTIANAVVGGGWHFPPRSELFSSLPGLVTGDATSGLATTPNAYATAHQLWFWIALTELVVIVVIALVLRPVLRQHGPSRIQGMASHREADQLLGTARLRRNAAMIRPDLYAKKSS